VYSFFTNYASIDGFDPQQTPADWKPENELDRWILSELNTLIEQVDGFYGVNDLPEILKDLKVDYKKELLGERHLTTPGHYAYLKVSEGCDRSCSFCAIPLIRGGHVSVTEEELLKEAEFLASQGVKELLLIAQDLTYYGIDLYGKRTIARLVEKLSNVNGIEWIRLHYAYPAGFPEELLQLMNDNPKVCKYLDIPLQHISNRILKSMKRGLGQDGIRNRIHRLRSAIPEIAIRTTLIVGYPGETEDDFNSLRDFVEEMKFDRLGIFTYSEEEGTGAAHLDDNIPRQVKDDRKNILLEIQHEISLDRNESFVGKTLKVLVDQEGENVSVGRTEYDSPEIDNIVHIQGKVDKGNFVSVRIESANEYELIGSIV
jgi:ribosomal protein S12 methylthiotransferase